MDEDRLVQAGRGGEQVVVGGVVQRAGAGPSVDHRADVTQPGGAPFEFRGGGLRAAGRQGRERAEFGEHGLEAATIRGIAHRAKVDPSLVMQHYGSKAALFSSAIQLGEAGSGEIEAHLHDVLDVRLAALPPETKALVRSMLTAPEAAAQVSAFLNERAANLSRAMSGDDADLRAALTVSSILGLIIARHFLQFDAFARASDAEIARVARPWITAGACPATGQHSRASTHAD